MAHLFRTRLQIARLEGVHRALVGLELVQQDGVVFAIVDVTAEVVDSK